MTETPQLSIYERTFDKSEKTDAILVVDGKRLHVNKALLSYHSDYFNVLFNSDFKEKSMEEIPIGEVNFEDFATVLSLVHSSPIKYKNEPEQLDYLLEIADRFQLPAVKRHIELFLITSHHEWDTLIEIADKYQLNDLMDITVLKYSKAEYFGDRCVENGFYVNKPKIDFFEKLSDETNIKFFHQFLKLKNSITKSAEKKSPQISIYEKAFAKSDKTDAILVVNGKEMHVNKAVLSYHSDYFNTLFSSEIEKIEIEDVDFEEFATLLSMIHLNPIAPTKENAVTLLRLSDEFTIPCAAYYLESSLILAQLTSLQKILIGEKFELSELFQNGVNTLNKKDFMDLPSNSVYQELSSGTKKKLFLKSLECLQL